VNASGGSARILVADDEDGTLTLITIVLTRAGFTVIGARDGTEALLRARESPPDLALLDVMMPGMDGREVCRRMASDPLLSHVPVILQSGADEREIDWRACGADGFLPKPFTARELPDIIRGHLSSRAHGDGPRARRLTDEEVRAMARRILKAVRRPPNPNPRDGVLSPYSELAPEDEARVEAALAALLGEKGELSAGEESSDNAESSGYREHREDDDSRE
jgi:DNA-binding response OmpR family regulator